MSEDKIREKIMRDIEEFCRERRDVFIPGKTRIRYSGAVYDEKEVSAMVNAVLDGWFGLGKRGAEFERGLASFIGVKNALLANSGSSANLIAITALMNRNIRGRLSPGDEVITPAVTFPTTFNPLLQNGLVPIVMDVNPKTYNIEASEIEKAVTSRTKALMLPHTLGNPNEMDVIMDVAEKYGLFVLEDACDALGSKYAGRMLGSFGDIATFSFYPAHHITMGEGGAAVTDDDVLAKIMVSVRDWGRDCWCRTDQNLPEGACGNRFNFKINGIPYDHKYTYSRIGYNLKPTEIQAAMGVEQLKKLPHFAEARKRNFAFLRDALAEFEDLFIFPESLPKADPCWFAFPLTIREGSGIGRNAFVSALERRNIETRLMFAGNIIRQPAYEDSKYRVVGNLENADRVMNGTFFLGTFPGMTKEKLDYIVDAFKACVKETKK
jgi:CDP-6-deoxy-D-xylo-4-hexulose-3-dehydrase